MRSSGILLPVTSLPSAYGIGSLSREAYEFVDMLEAAGQKIWQILPLTPVGYGNSPYQSFSTFAGNPYLIDPNQLKEAGLLTEAELEAAGGGEADPSCVDYDQVYEKKTSLFRKAFMRFQSHLDFEQFVQSNGYWLEDYALYRAIKSQGGMVPWSEWEDDIRDRKPLAIQKAREELWEEIQFHRFIQYTFYSQWESLKAYANSKGIQILGDLPIYVSFDSADAWSNPLLFQFNENNEPISVAGCPPDYFAPDGQLWGNPLYSWEYHRETGFQWWISRMSHSYKLYDIVRIDHFRGFDEYYSIPYGSTTARYGHWVKGPGLELFHALRNAIPDMKVIAEDLGFLTESVHQLVRDTGFPGMKVLEFAFDEGPSNLYLPHNIQANSILYTGTHDNDTLKGWIASMPDHTAAYARDYLAVSGEDADAFVWAFIRLAMASVAERVVIPMQDYLCLGSEGRINTPSTVGDNWKWRMKKGDFTGELAGKIRHLAEIYGRV